MEYYLHDGKIALGPFAIADLVKQPGFHAAALVFPVDAVSEDAWKPAAACLDIVSAMKPAAPPSRNEIVLTLPPLKPREPDPPPSPSFAPPAEKTLAMPSETPSTGESAPSRAAPSEKLVLVVDDDPAVLSFIEMSAILQGFRVVTAANGLEAAKKMSEKPADLIVTDLMMPGQGGYEFLRALQAEGGPRVPVFVISGSVLDDSTIRMIRQEANVVEFLSKPIRISSFINALHKHLNTTPR